MLIFRFYNHYVLQHKHKNVKRKVIKMNLQQRLLDMFASTREGEYHLLHYI